MNMVDVVRLDKLIIRIQTQCARNREWRKDNLKNKNENNF